MEGFMLVGVRPLTGGESDEKGYGIFCRNAYVIDRGLTVTRGRGVQTPRGSCRYQCSVRMMRE